MSVSIRRVVASGALAVLVVSVVACDSGNPLAGRSDCTKVTIEFDPPVLTPETIDDGDPFLTVIVTDEYGQPADGVFLRWENKGFGLGLSDETTSNGGRIWWDFQDLGQRDTRAVATTLSTQEDLFVEHRRQNESPYCDGPGVRIPVDWPPPDPDDFPEDRTPPPPPIEPRD